MLFGLGDTVKTRGFQVSRKGYVTGFRWNESMGFLYNTDFGDESFRDKYRQNQFSYHTETLMEWRVLLIERADDILNYTKAVTAR